MEGKMRKVEEAGVQENEDSSRGGNQEESARRYLQHRRRGRRRTVKLPATLQEKRGTLRCILKPAKGKPRPLGGENGRTNREEREGSKEEEG
ncbi:hypothetical protein NDU88_006339 [Pleurodeles waltl]|uniref:Uncharacterized protein n=1 Tax=Pleurodeles waltl TaxID=8319 RepID=A0AAV7TF88_PLEWA|nr:hypothetical protein NDU88_006339 [Pleurodeles waltl]